MKQVVILRPTNERLQKHARPRVRVQVRQDQPWLFTQNTWGLVLIRAFVEANG